MQGIIGIIGHKEQEPDEHGICQLFEVGVFIPGANEPRKLTGVIGIREGEEEGQIQAALVGISANDLGLPVEVAAQIIMGAFGDLIDILKSETPQEPKVDIPNMAVWAKNFVDHEHWGLLRMLS